MISEHVLDLIAGVSVKDSEGIIHDRAIMKKEVKKSFFYKHSDWSYEKEWRIIKRQEEPFLYYSEEELACIIFGGNLDSNIRDIIINSINKRPKFFYTKIGYRSFCIDILPIAYKVELAGEIPPFIRNIKALKKEIITP